MFPQQRSQSNDLFCKLVYCFLYDGNIGFKSISASKLLQNWLCEHIVLGIKCHS